MSLALRWYPPAWVQIKTREKTIYLDPSYLKKYFKDHPTAREYSNWPDEVDGLPDDLEKADIILVTHHHKDHVKKVTVDRISGPDTLIMAPGRVKKALGNRVRVVAPGDELELDEVKIKVVPAYNTPEGSSTRKFHKLGEGVGYLLEIEGHVIYHAGDTDLIPEMDGLGPVDVAFLPIGGTYTMNVEEAAQAALRIQPSLVVPIHHLQADPQDLQVELRGGGMKVRVLRTGELLMIGE
ncbi:MAG: MBL fold metallo-hydrolase [Euryarchaeota archaeon]|jgi:L-ascorbate metabolism protein UlaG (beta-lactamase superfamily)|nr:MBL fold metallo-hydrolase [Euryarchaeota archaeon]